MTPYLASVFAPRWLPYKTNAAALGSQKSGQAANLAIVANILTSHRAGLD